MNVNHPFKFSKGTQFFYTIHISQTNFLSKVSSSWIHLRSTTLQCADLIDTYFTKHIYSEKLDLS